MKNKLLEAIFNDLKNNAELVNVLKQMKLSELSELHFSLGMSIRNKYLWTNQKSIEPLYFYYHVNDIDSLSSCIIKDFYLQLKTI